MVYRDPLNTVYYPGWKLNKDNELKITGYYQITGLRYSLVDKSHYGQVYVTRYHDGDRTDPKNFTPVNSSSPMGTGLLGCELGYIIDASNPAHRFGKGYYEADE